MNKTIEKRTIPLGKQCFVDYYRGFLEESFSVRVYKHLLQALPWEQETIQLFGKEHLQPRLTAWLGKGLSAYSKYSEEIPAHPWDEDTTYLLEQIQNIANASFNSALVNYYRDGNEYMGFHADDEKSLGLAPIIASLSLGAERDFVFKDKNSGKTVYSIKLEQGSLLVMRGKTQEHFKHGLPKRLKVNSGRINLTFRMIQLP